jgi:hypothetical protein
MFGVDLSSREGDGHVIVALRGELDILDAAGVADALATVTAREPWVLRVLAARLLDLFSVHSNVEEAVSRAGSCRRAAGPVASSVVPAAP